LTAFGAFVDLGGVEGLVHISEISWQRVGHPSEVLELGQSLQVFVIDVDPDQGRIGLSLKRLQPDPWLDVEERYQVGEVVEGTITNVVSFGAFARLEEGLEGLIHVSELAEGEFFHPNNIVREGDQVRVCVLNVDGKRRRLGLSLRRVPGSREPGDDGRKPQP
jgi:small subunit ribosomal protein S1